jgi:DNA-directed RNA polymerase specialized sigma24 family protein
LNRLTGSLKGFSSGQDVGQLLWDDFDQWLTSYQRKIRKVVQYHSYRFVIDSDTRDDLVQDINIFLLEKKDYLKKVCSRDGNPDGFFSTIINRHCMHLIKKAFRRRQNLTVVLPAPPALNPEELMVLKDEVTRLEAILRTFHSLRPSLELCLKLSFHFPLHNENVTFLTEKVRPAEKKLLLEKYPDLHLMTEQEAYRFIAPYLDKYEGKSIQFSSRIRRTANHKMEIRTLLNEGGKFHYNEEALRYLFDLYFVARINSETED